MDNIKKHFEKEAADFDDIIKKLIPHYGEMLDGMVAAIPYPKDAAIKVIDLGCGTGTISKLIKQAFPKAQLTCLDLAENMIEMARLKLKDYPGVCYRVGDAGSYTFDKAFDVVVSSLALHHLENDQAKITLYRNIYQTLTPGGIFLNADVVLGSGEHLQNLYLHKWKSFMQNKVSKEEIEQKWLRQYQQEDRPARLMDQLAWLEEIGFCEIDVIWKYYNFAVYGGRKAAFA